MPRISQFRRTPGKQSSSRRHIGYICSTLIRHLNSLDLMKIASIFLFLLCLSTSAFAQNSTDEPWLSTGQHYVGADLGLDITTYIGGENFLWPMIQGINDPVS